MNQKGVSLALVTVILIGAFFTVVGFVPGDVRATTLFVGGIGPGNHTTIQAAIDNATNGDTVYVYSGTYFEEISVNKSINLIGEDKNTTVIKGSGMWLVVHVRADYVNITGFNITNGGWNDPGIYITDVRYCTITNNIISNNDNGITSWLLRSSIIGNNTLYSNLGNGITLYQAQNSIITDNIVMNSSGHGIYLEESSNITIVNNSVSPNNEYGVSIEGSVDIILSDNDLTSSVLDVYLHGSMDVAMVNTAMNGGGVFVRGTSLESWNSHSIDASNVVNGKPVYYFKDTSGGTVPADAGQVILANSSGVLVDNYDFIDIYSGIQLGFSSFNIIANNTATSGVYGMYVTESHNNTIANNSLSTHEKSGMYLYRSDHNSLTDNDVGDSNVGIWILDSDENILDNNTCHGNQWQGIYLFMYSDNNTVINNTVTLSYYGISIDGGRFNNIERNKVLQNNYSGIDVWLFDSNTVTKNNASLNNVSGIRIHSSNNTVSDNDVFSNGMYGINLFMAENNSIVNNRVHLNEERGLSLESSDYNTIAYNNVSYNLKKGIWLSESSWNLVEGNSISANNMSGIYLTESHNNTITQQKISSNIFYGIILHKSLENVITDSIISNNSYYGIFLFEFCDSNEIHDNEIRNNTYAGINIGSSQEVTISGNVLTENGIILSGESVEFWNTHSIDSSNSVNSKPLYYWKDVVGGQIPLGAGQIILANCTDVVVQEQTLHYATKGIQVAFSSNITIDAVDTAHNWGDILLYFTDYGKIINSKSSDSRFGITIRSSNYVFVEGVSTVNNEIGIKLYHSDNGVITNSNASFSELMGIQLLESNGNVVANSTASFSDWYGLNVNFGLDNHITGNTICRNSLRGIYISGSTRNKVIGNNICNNKGYGMEIRLSRDIEVFHNNFINNDNQSLEVQDLGNSWDNGYPSGGNYWSDYAGIDVKSGPNQDQAGSDGIGDVPYDIIGDVNKDHYPLMTPVIISSVFPPSAPRNLQAYPGDEQVELVWEVPSSDGNSAISGYRIYRGTHTLALNPIDEVGAVRNYTDSGLMNGQTYYYAVTAINEVGEGPRSNQANATPSVPPPNQPPICSIQSPTPSTTVNGTYTIAGNSSDPDGAVEKVEIRIDGGQWILAMGNESWTYDWDTTTVADGNHTIYARSYDGENYSTEVSLILIVDNYIQPPPEEPRDDSGWTAIVAAAILVITIVIIMILYWLARKKREVPEAEENRVDEDLPPE
jgi:parallel beta-helix repeat protein